MRILVRRIGALGDVVLTTPVVRRLRRENPGAEIAVQTGYPDVFRNSPHRLVVLPPGVPPWPWTPDGGMDRTIELDLAYERFPGMHIVRAYMQEAFNDFGFHRENGLSQELFFEPPAAWPSGRRIVAVHAARAGWRSRTLPEATWLKVVEGLRREGFFPLLVGLPRDALPKAKAASFHHPDLLAQAGVISRCACFVGSDSGLLHAAGATDVPIVGIYTSAPAFLRTPLRGRKLVPSGWPDGGRFKTVLPEGLDCLGCLRRAPVPATTESCERGDFSCVGAVSAERIVEAVVRLAA